MHKAALALGSLVLLFTLRPLSAAKSPGAGTISGKLTFPSEFIPALRVYAVSEDGKRYFAVATRQDQQSFTLTGVAPGRYVMVAFPDEEVGDLTSAGWVRNGTLAPVDVAPGKAVSGVVINEWFAGDQPAGFPPEPPPTPGLGVNAPPCLGRSPRLAVDACNLQAWENADRALNAEYQRAMAMPELKPRCRTALQQAQRAWITFRDGHCGYEGEAQESGRRAECLAEMTAERVSYLKQQDSEVCLR